MTHSQGHSLPYPPTPPGGGRTANQQNALVLSIIGGVALLVLIATITVAAAKSGGAGDVCDGYAGNECQYLQRVSDVPKSAEAKLWYGYAGCHIVANEDKQEPYSTKYYDLAEQFDGDGGVVDLDFEDIRTLDLAAPILCPELH